jgi:hypothetical protein
LDVNARCRLMIPAIYAGVPKFRVMFCAEFHIVIQ